MIDYELINNSGHFNTFQKKYETLVHLQPHSSASCIVARSERFSTKKEAVARGESIASELRIEYKHLLNTINP